MPDKEKEVATADIKDIRLYVQDHNEIGLFKYEFSEHPWV
jgi:hypothetical protein